MLHAEFDPVGEVMLAVIDPADPYRTRQPTGAPATPGVEPVLLPLRSRWPDPYLPDLPDLLGPMVLEHDREAGVLTRTWPTAAYAPESVRAARRASLDESAHRVLARTDWTITRRAELGTPVPSAVLEQRTAVRQWHEQAADDLTFATLADLVDGARWQLPRALDT